MVRIRVANRVAIAIRNPETFWNGGYDQGYDQGCDQVCDQGCDRNPELQPEITTLVLSV